MFNLISEQILKRLFGAFVLLGFCFSPVAQAGLIFVNESDGTHDSAFFIDSGDASTDFIDLEFGNTIDAKLRYEVINDQFVLNRDLDLGGNEVQNLSLEKLASAPTCDGTAIGRLYYNTVDSLTYSCDGVFWSPLENVLNTAIALPVVQARRTSVFNLTNAYVDVDLDTTDQENDVTALDHDDTLRDRINIGEDGLYQIIYGYTAGGTATSTHEARARVRANDTTVLEGSQSVNRNYQNEFSTTSASFLANLSAGDFVSLQLFRNTTTDATQDEIFFSVVKLEGLKGEAGADGVNGGDTDANTFIIDNDDTGGDVSLQFGATLSESLTWDNANTRFNLSDDLQVQGDINFTGDLVSPCGAYSTHSFERGTIVSNQSWAVGNGQTPWGVPMACAGQVNRLAATCTGASGTSLSAVLYKNDVATTCSVNISTTLGTATVASCTESFVATDVIGVYAGTEVGNWTECVGSIWVKYD